jgi:hypothetical protein
MGDIADLKVGILKSNQVFLSITAIKSQLPALADLPFHIETET